MPQKPFAPETAVGTGAAEPVVDEYEAAKATPSVDESTLDEVGHRSTNQPGQANTIEYSGETHREAIEGQGLETTPVGDDTSEEPSTGADLETRRKDDDTVAGSAVDAQVDASEVNSKAADVRPEVPQAARRDR